MHRSESCGRLTLCYCGVFNPVFLCAECQGDLIGQMEGPTIVGKFAAFSVKTYIPFLKYACAFVLPFRSCRVLAGPHTEEKPTYHQLANGSVQMCVCPLVDVED